LKLRPCGPVALFLLLVPVAAPPQPGAVDRARRIDELLSRYHEYGQFNGVTLVAEDGQVAFEKAYGYANMEWKIPNTLHTKFRIGSLTKQFTAMLIMQLVQEGRLRLDGTVSEYLPYYRRDTGGRVTLHFLLTHSSGLPNYTSSPQFPVEARNPQRVADMVTRLCSGDLEFEPGTQYRYSNSNYIILGAILEEVTAKRYETLLRERIFGPLNMKDSGYDHAEALLESRAAGYERIPGPRFRNAAYIDMSVPYAAGALYSTVHDLLKWDQALYRDELLNSVLRGRMFTPFLGSYAYGWGSRVLPDGEPGAGQRIYAHAGGVNGFSSFILRMPDSKKTIILLNNVHNDGLGQIAFNLRNILFGHLPAAPKRSILDAVSTTLDSRGVAAAIAQFRELRAQHPNEFDFAEQQLNAFGYQLLSEGRTNEAIEILKLNTETYPDSANGYDSLAEAYSAAGNIELAIANYERALKLDPKNTHAEAQLKALRTPK
jgi:CubicO group peptidase (beta-lactamase class C family)